MRSILPILLALASLAAAQDRATNTVVLDSVAEANLGIETTGAEQGDFEETIFALGEIRHTCESHSVLSSRISGRIAEVIEHQGDFVEQGEVVARIESRQPGSPPPVLDLTAPGSGLIVKSEAHLGAPVEPSQELMEILDLTTVWAVARVPQHEAAVLQPGMTARIRVPAVGNEPLQAAFHQLGTEADPVQGFIEAIFVLENPGNRLRPGMRAELEIVSGKRADVVTVPRDAVQGQGGDRFVFIRDYELEHAFVKVPVKVGATNGEHTEILSGLMPGDEVVTTGAYPLAFAGGGSASLKEALDAAHGHPHNEDGTEMSKEQIAAGEGGHDHDHDHAHEGGGPLVLFLSIACGVLLVLLIASPFVFRHRAAKA